MTKVKLAIVGVLALVAFSAAASSAYAASITTRGGAFTATTAALQTLTSRLIVGGSISVTCNQTIVFSIAGGTYTVGTLSTNARVTSATFACNEPGTTVRTLTTTVAWPIRINTGSATTILGTVLNVAVNVVTPLGTCLFSGNVNFSVNNGGTTNGGLLLGGTLTSNSFLCTTGTVSSAPYNISPAFTWTFA